eukprot:scaffold6397_cov175-Ochromonas_danica.AAC.13
MPRDAAMEFAISLYLYEESVKHLIEESNLASTHWLLRSEKPSVGPDADALSVDPSPLCPDETSFGVLRFIFLRLMLTMLRLRLWDVIPNHLEIVHARRETTCTTGRVMGFVKDCEGWQCKGQHRRERRETADRTGSFNSASISWKSNPSL